MGGPYEIAWHGHLARDCLQRLLENRAFFTGKMPVPRLTASFSQAPQWGIITRNCLSARASSFTATVAIEMRRPYFVYFQRMSSTSEAIGGKPSLSL
jgi:hypothetical protein